MDAILTANKRRHLNDVLSSQYDMIGLERAVWVEATFAANCGEAGLGNSSCFIGEDWWVFAWMQLSAFIRKVNFSQDTRLACWCVQTWSCGLLWFSFNNEYGAGFYRFDEAFTKVGWPLDSGYRPEQPKPLPAKYPSHAPATVSGMELTGIDGNLYWQT